MNLVRAEFQRLTARRFTRVMVLVLLVTFGITVATTLASSHRPTAAELRVAEQDLARQREFAADNHSACLAARQADAPELLRERFGGIDCELFDPDRVRLEDQLTGVFIFADAIEDLVLVLSALLAMFGFLVGASFIGAEMTSGGMTNLLLWCPDRARVYATKLGVLLAAMGGAGAVATVGYVAGFWGLAEMVGYPGRQGGEFWGHLALLCLRGIGLALMSTALAFAIATATRHTSAAVGLITGYLVVWEIGARIVLELTHASWVGAWMLSTYLDAWMTGRVVLDNGFQQCLPTQASDSCFDFYVLHWWHALLVLAALLTLWVGGSFAHFRRRDLV